MSDLTSEFSRYYDNLNDPNVRPQEPMRSFTFEPDPDAASKFTEEYSNYLLKLEAWRKRMLEMPGAEFVLALEQQMIRNGKLHEELLNILDYRGRVKALNNSAASPSLD